MLISSTEERSLRRHDRFEVYANILTGVVSAGIYEGR
jgi:hypothetical protein